MPTSHRVSQQSGFSLIELMIVLVIIAVLTGIALPAYQNQIIKGHRANAQSEMMDIANRQQQFLLSDRIYASKTLLIASGFAPDPDMADNYTYTITVGTGTVPSFLVTYTAVGRQASDGDLTLDEKGKKTPVDKW